MYPRAVLDFKNKADFLKEIKDLLLPAKTVKDRTVKMSSANQRC